MENNLHFNAMVKRLILITVATWGTFSVANGQNLEVTAFLKPTESCGLSANEAVELQIANAGSSSVSSGTTFNVAFEFDNNNPNVESNTLSSSLAAGDSISYTFSTTVDLSQEASMHDLKGWVSWSNDNNANDDTVTKSIMVPSTPNADFSFGNNCARSPVSFVDNSSGIADSLIGFSVWEYGDGTSDTIIPSGQFITASHTYTYGATYSVKYTAISSSGCSNSITKNVTINPTPDAQFSIINDGCAGDTINFLNNTGNAQQSNVSYEWDFESDGTVDASVENPEHVFQSQGNYNVQLIATSNKNCQGVKTKSFNVKPTPQTDFSLADTQICEGNALTPNNTTTYVGNDTVFYQWNFGDGSQSSNEDVSHTYQQTGTFELSLTAGASQSGCNRVKKQMLSVEPSPEGGFISEDVCQNTPVTFIDTSTFAGNEPLNYSWSFSNTNKKNPTFRYNDPVVGVRNLTVLQTVTAANSGCASTVSNQIQVFESPKPDFNAPNTCLDNAVQFSNQTNYNGSEGLRYKWKFDNDFINAGENPSRQFDETGSQSVSMIAETNARGCRDTVTKPVQIDPLPSPAFSVTGGACVGTSVDFANNTTYEGPTSNLEYEWDFGNGSNSNNETPTTTYNSNGDFNVTLEATDNQNGCSNATSKDIKINPKPTSTFSYTRNGLQIVFSPDNQTYSSYEWDFGDGTSSTTTRPSHEYDSKDNYPVTLTVTTATGCSNTNTDTAKLLTGIADHASIEEFDTYPNPFAEAFNIKYALNHQSNVTLEVYTNTGQRIERIVDENQTSGKHSYEFNPERNDQTAGVYLIRLVIDGETYQKQVISTD